MGKINGLDLVAVALVVIGSLNWGLVGLFNFNLVDMIFGSSIISSVIYSLVAIAAVYLVALFMNFDMKCNCRTESQVM